MGNVCPWTDVNPNPAASISPGGGPRILMLGRLSPWKGQNVFLDAFAGAFPNGGASAVIAGEALFGEESYGAQLREQVRRLGLDEFVEFTGHVDDTRSLIESSDIVVHASTSAEPFGQVVVEAMALGRPAIASNAGGPAEIITDGVNGLLIEPGNSADLAEAMRQLAADNEMRVSLACAARDRAREFTPSRIGAEVHDVYDRLVGQRSLG